MSYTDTDTISLTTAADGSATGYSKVFNGEIASIQYVKTDFADGVDFTITTENTGRNIWTELNVNASVDKMPRQQTNSQDGTAGSYDDNIAIAEERVKIVIASGGDTKSGTFHVNVS